MSAKRSDPWLPGFLQVAQKLHAQSADIPKHKLQHCLQVSLLRRVLLSKLHKLDVCRAPDVYSQWQQALDLGCPLLDPGLDVGSIDPIWAASACCLAESDASLGELYQRLQDFQLTGLDAGDPLGVKIGRTSRRRSGSFFTPGWMADRLAHLIFDPDRAQKPSAILPTILDPACGNGRLLIACINLIFSQQAWDETTRQHNLRGWIADRLISGVDLNPIACALTKTALWLLSDPKLGRLPGLEQSIVTGDALVGQLDGSDAEGIRWDRLMPADGFEVVVANPPFEVLKGFSSRMGLAHYVRRIRHSGYKLALSGNLNTYRLFLERSLQLLAAHGRLAFVIPFGFLMDRTACGLRRHMLSHGWLEQVITYPESARAFFQVGQSVILMSAQKTAGHAAAIDVFDGLNPAHKTTINLSQLQSLDKQQMVLPLADSRSIELAARLQKENRSNVSELAIGRVGELDQTVYREFIKDQPTDCLLVRGVHLAPFAIDLSETHTQGRWVDRLGFEKMRRTGRWRQDIAQPRIVQTGIVNMEARRRLVAGEVPAQTVLGNSVNYWVARPSLHHSGQQVHDYLLGLLNSRVLEWRFRLTSSNNNINLYEVNSLPVPKPIYGFDPVQRTSFVSIGLEAIINADQLEPSRLLAELVDTARAPMRNDWAVACLIGAQARLLSQSVNGNQERTAYQISVLDHLVAWHLGLDQSDLQLVNKTVEIKSRKA